MCEALTMRDIPWTWAPKSTPLQWTLFTIIATMVQVKYNLPEYYAQYSEYDK